MRTKHNAVSILWILPLIAAFLCFGLFMAVKHNIYQKHGDALYGESSADQAMIIKGLNENGDILAEELISLDRQLAEAYQLTAGGKSLEETIEQRIEALEAIIGAKAVIGPGLRISIEENGTLMYYDLIDMANELFAAGAEAIAINDIRYTAQTMLGETSADDGRYLPTINGSILEYPIIITAIGAPSTLEAGLTYPGGIIESLNMLYRIYPQIDHGEKLLIPAAEEQLYKYGTVPTEDTARKN